MEAKLTRLSVTMLRFLIGALFVYAGILKAMEPTAFLQDIENYRILPHAAAVLAMLYLPYLEILCGASLVLKRLDAGALGLLGILMLVFTGALLSAWARGLSIECGCFGSGGGPVEYLWALVRDLVILAALGLLGWRAGWNQSRPVNSEV